ncbi:hypothetical protein EJ07DRAFT_169400 [Lizonia empirigonia]|nr:hypothetical protein EJ07DRAFT_170109 [Lizonia empirigonia]KAF1349332.1 hypothetical protein EJ07DRAFT_169400 [Lizonia empirigonia]
MLRILSLLGFASAVAAQFNIRHTQYGTSPPVYPSPQISGTGGWDAALGKAQAFLAELTTEEKAQIVTGTAGPCVGNIGPIERLNFSGLCLQDGPLAIRQVIHVSRGAYIGAEFKGKGAHVALGPVIGPLGRSPFGGRNWEGVQACTKHYILNEQEIQRNPTTVNGTTIEAASSNVDDKTRINGSYGCQNSKTLNGLLKDELGFQGYVMSDWLATHSGVASVKAGLDMNMPGGFDFASSTSSFFGGNITTAVTVARQKLVPL